MLEKGHLPLVGIPRVGYGSGVEPDRRMGFFRQTTALCPAPGRRMRKFLILLMVVLGLSLGSADCQGQERVLVIHSYDLDLEWTNQCNRGISSVLADKFLLDHVYLDTKRIPESEFQRRSAEALQTFRRLDPDVVMLGDDNALRLLGPAISETGTPVVYFGINGNPRNYLNPMPRNVIGILERIPLFPWIRYLCGIVPDTRRVLVLMDESPTSAGLVEVTFGARRQVEFDGCTVSYETTNSWDQWQRLVLAPERHDLILVPVFHSVKDAGGTHVPYEEVIRWTSKNSSVPVFATQDYAVGDDGVVGAYTIFGEEHGRMAALMVKGILEGVDMLELSVAADQKGLFYFNKKQLDRFGLILTEEVRNQAIFR
ncbi:hypothetical protein GKC30_04445 [Pseudodesulfovibrio sp. F-1]|uniref:ABC transporter substrate-binding protein n=1 Tax=Pseudodesulfovibrio alkaliphilus TaxID=2661613 RepID=A0A7K1KLF4_9BACT|nr:ABC transporter substrate binding protein [Pseudodesulfovibrio alkaliphilus]MUM76880.1 hypothetical protein [Pseudodesulfovibrio alkaliphilus]